jgi:hypothetical protein
MATKRIRVIHAILIEGEHAEAGSIHDVPGHMAAHLVGSGCAEFHAEDGENPPAPATTVRMETPDNRDPKPARVAPKPKAKSE